MNMPVVLKDVKAAMLITENSKRMSPFFRVPDFLLKNSSSAETPKDNQTPRVIVARTAMGMVARNIQYRTLV